MGVTKERMQEIQSVLTGAFLRENYVNRRFSIAGVAELARCSEGTVSNYLRKFNLFPREGDIVLENGRLNFWKSILTREFLERRYIQERETLETIAEEVGCSHTIIWKYLREYDLPVRSISEVMTGKKMPPRTEEHKANLIASHTGKKRSLTIRQKFSQLAIARGAGHCNKGKKRKPASEESCRKRLTKVCARPNMFETKCLRYLDKIYPDKFRYTGDGTFVRNGRSVDAYSEDLGIVCLFQGNYWHCNPKMYKATYHHQLLGKTAEEIWGSDEKAVKIFENAGYRVILIWEDEIDKLLEARCC